MRESYRFGAVAAVAMLVLVMAPTSSSAGDTNAEWTFMVYLDADNSLESWGVLNLEWLESVGSVEGKVNFVVLMDTLSGVADLLYVEDGYSTPVEDIIGRDLIYPTEVDMASPETLQGFIEICCEEFPADKYALILWDHGGGWRGLCWDDTTSEDACISMVELREAVRGAYNNTGEIMDVIGFDQCLMAMPEVAYQVRDCADYVVFSEETVPGQGFPYDAIAEELVLRPGMDGKQLSEVIVAEYAAYYAELNYKDVTISAFEMAYMEELKCAVNALGWALYDSLNVYMGQIQRDLLQAQEYYYPYDVDLRGFACNLFGDRSIEDAAIKDAAKLVIAAVDHGVFACINGDHNDESSGLAIYVPATNDGMHSLKDDYIYVPFATETSWYGFVDAFSNWEGRTWAAEKVA